MGKKFRSINYKLYKIMLVTIVLFFGTVLILDVTVIKKIKEDFVFNRLEDHVRRVSKIKVTPKKHLLNASWVKHFLIRKTPEGTYIPLGRPREFLPRRGKEIDNRKLFSKIATNITNSKKETRKGKIKNENKVTLYLVDWKINEDEKGTDIGTVFLATLPKNTDLEKGLLIGIIALFIISFFVSKLIAKKITDPIKALKGFAEEVAKKNWEAEVPITDSDEIGLLADALEKMRDSLRVSDERDREFLQSTSHDLKTPVMIIKGYAQSMIDGVVINTEKTGAEVIKAESERLERKITQLLRLNTLSHSLEYNEGRECIRLDKIIRSLILKFEVINPNIEWIVDLKPVEVLGDSEALLIAFENIIENQLRFAKKYISIIITNSNIAGISISNDGPPFEIEDTKTLFETYIRGREGKFGLGLAIVKQVIDSHEGEIEAYNKNIGVEFKIRLKNNLK